MSGPSYDTVDVPVVGGALRVGRWTSSDPQAPVVLAAHGVTANHPPGSGWPRSTGARWSRRTCAAAAAAAVSPDRPGSTGTPTTCWPCSTTSGWTYRC